MSYSNLKSRSIIPLEQVHIQAPISFALQSADVRRRDILQLPGGANAVPDLHNVQGDVFYVFPKVSAKRFMLSIVANTHTGIRAVPLLYYPGR